MPVNRGDGGPGHDGVNRHARHIAVDSQGNVYIATNDRVRKVNTQGTINLLAGGGGNQDTVFQGGQATKALLTDITGLTLAPNGGLYLADATWQRIFHIGTTLPSFTNKDIFIPSEDGTQLFHFDPAGRHLRTLDSLTGAVLYRFGYDSKGGLIEIEDASGNVTAIERDANGRPTAIVAPWGQHTSLTQNSGGYLESVTNPAGETTRFQSTGSGLLTGMTDPRGNSRHYTYDAAGLLVKAENPAGGYLTLHRDDFEGGYAVRVRNALGETTTYRVEDLSNGDQRQRITTPSGEQTDELRSPDGRRSITYPDGTVVETELGPDARFGMAAPLLQSAKITTPGGLVQTASAAASATLSSPGAPLSLTQLSTAVTVNGQSWTTVYDASLRQFTSTTPEGRRTVTTLDDLGRVIAQQQGLMEASHFAYDARGRFTEIRQGRRGRSGSSAPPTTPRGDWPR